MSSTALRTRNNRANIVFNTKHVADKYVRKKLSADNHYMLRKQIIINRYQQSRPQRHRNTFTSHVNAPNYEPKKLRINNNTDTETDTTNTTTKTLTTKTTTTTTTTPTTTTATTTTTTTTATTTTTTTTTPRATTRRATGTTRTTKQTKRLREKLRDGTPNPKKLRRGYKTICPHIRITL